MISVQTLVLFLALGFHEALTESVCLPEEIHAKLDIFGGGFSKTQAKPYSLKGNLDWYSSAQKKRVYARNDVYYADTHFQFESLDDYSVQPPVRYEFAEGKCTKKPVNFPELNKFCIPDNATVLAQTFIGSGENITAYEFSIQGYSSRITVTSVQNIPVIQEETIDTGDGGILQTAVFYEPSLAIPDQSVFNVPEICKQQNMTNPLE